MKSLWGRESPLTGNEVGLLFLFQFNESWRLLLDWMTEVEQTLDTHKEIAVSHEEIKQQLTEQKVQSLPPPSAIHMFANY